MTPEERRKIEEAYRRWKTLSPEQKALLKKRHDRLEEERRATDHALPDDDRKRIDKQPVERRQKELTDRTLKLLKERVDRLPPELQKKIRDELKNAPPGERAERLRRLLQEELAPQIRAAFRRRVAAGELSRDEVETLAKAVRSAPTTRERAHLLRDFILAHPNAFRLNPKVRERLKKNSDPLEELRLIEQQQPRPKAKGQKGAKPN
jgi:TRAP-type C4-dicarboxylate transport system substrate-binding protein